MMLDVCLEASGAYAHLVGADMVNSMLPLRSYRWRRAGRAPVADGFEERLNDAVDRLPILLAHVLWLIDICGCTYETAAAELGTSPERVEHLMVEARRHLRDELVSGPRRSPEESTSQFQPTWRPPNR